MLKNNYVTTCIVVQRQDRKPVRDKPKSNTVNETDPGKVKEAKQNLK